MADVVRATDFRERLAGIASCQGLSSLMRGELGLAAHPNASSPRALSTFARPRADELAFELGQSAKYGQHEPAVRRRCVSPYIAERAEVRPILRDCREGIEEI